MTDEHAPFLNREAEALADEMRVMFAGRDRMIVGAVLADLTATWLASHFDKRGPAATKRMREVFLKVQMQAIRDMIEPCEALLLQRCREEETHH